MQFFNLKSELHWAENFFFRFLPKFHLIFGEDERRVHESDSFFPDEYECVNHFFPARPDFPKFYVKDLKITQKYLFLYSFNAEDNKNFNAMHT